MKSFFKTKKYFNFFIIKKLFKNLLMRKNKTNYDIVYENQKDKIVFKIFSDNINEEFISISKDNDDSNNNDTLNFIAKVFIFLETNLYSFYNYLLNYLPSFQRTFYKIQYLFLIIALLFTFVYSYEDNSNISTNLIISAYFPSCSQLTYVKYDNIILEENNIKENNNKNNNKNIKYKDNKNHIKNKNDNNNDCENRYISEDLKSMMSSSANTKNTYVNYEKNINNKITMVQMPHHCEHTQSGWAISRGCFSDCIPSQCVPTVSAPMLAHQPVHRYPTKVQPSPFRQAWRSNPSFAIFPTLACSRTQTTWVPVLPICPTGRQRSTFLRGNTGGRCCLRYTAPPRRRTRQGTCIVMRRKTVLYQLV